MAAFGILFDLAQHHNLLAENDPLLVHLSRLGHRKFREFANFLKPADNGKRTYPAPKRTSSCMRSWRRGGGLTVGSSGAASNEAAARPAGASP
jgi:hypothetical protein